MLHLINTRNMGSPKLDWMINFTTQYGDGVTIVPKVML